MKLSIDLHMHSCLSPCGDEDMTPENLVGMAFLNGLDVIALCDHNTARNVPAAAHAAQERDLVLLPGLEVTTKEEVHVLCYFETVEQALGFSDALYPHIPDMPNVPRFFGRQVLMGTEDCVLGEEEKLLVSATDLSIEECIALAQEFGGLCVAAHVNRGANGLITNLGFVPPGAKFAALEMHRASPAPMQDLGKYKIFYASDAHRLEDMPDGGADWLEAEERSVEAVFAKLKEFYMRVHKK